MSSYTATSNAGIVAELKALGVTFAVIGPAYSDGRIAVVISKNGKEEIVTRQIFDSPDYRDWITAEFGDEGIAAPAEQEAGAHWQTDPGATIARVTARINELIANLPPLTGSEKQIDWANQIRLHFAQSFLRYHEEQSAYQHPGATAAGLAHGLPIMIKILEITESKFWIDGMRRKIAGSSIDLHEITAERWIAIRQRNPPAP